MIHCRPSRFFYRAETIFVKVDIAPIDKTAARGVKTALGAIELDRHFGAEIADLLKLQCNC